MRKLDFEKKLSEEDIAWIRQAGWPNGEDLIIENAERFGTKIPEPETDETVTRSAVGVEAVGTAPVIDPATGAVRRIEPTEQGGTEPQDDYDKWPVKELEDEVSAREAMPDTTAVTVTGTGKDGKVLKADLVKGLRLWDQENPEALKD